MVSKEVFEIVGMMDEELFIDYVDTEWCLRCLNYGILVHIIPDIEMVHAIGDKSVKICGINIPIHSPVRRYYRVRNAFLLLRKIMCLFYSLLGKLFFFNSYDFNYRNSKK